MDGVMRIMALRVHALTRKYEEEQKCRRKTVVTIAYKRMNGGIFEIGHWVNRPLFDDPTRCTNDVGGCGCLHSEPQAICSLLRTGYHIQPSPVILAVTYSPCTPCANIISASLAISEVYWLQDTEHDLRGINILGLSCSRAERIDP